MTQTIKDQQKRATREGYGQALLELGAENPKIVALSADLTESTCAHHFAEKYPQRFFQCGVAEQNMITMAAGLALEGLIPFASSFGVFLPMRCLDQIRISVGYNQANVKLVATHCGLATGEDGATHQALEDVAALRAIPNITIIEPADYFQAIKATKAAAEYHGPVYLRLHRGKFAAVTKETDAFKVGKVQVLQRGEKVTIIGSGPILTEVLKASSRLHFKPEIINCHTLKPLDETTIVQSVKKTGKVLVIQDHQINGGLGSAIAELLSQKLPAKMIILGMPDKFGESGTPDELWDRHRLSADEIVAQTHQLLK
ncbi:transketolase family protein [Candidatus Woesearchaeota archaeon]|nr:transketolase family protein [Candidatus Woesearchaeota archaeon]